MRFILNNLTNYVEKHSQPHAVKSAINLNEFEFAYIYGVFYSYPEVF